MQFGDGIVTKLFLNSSSHLNNLFALKQIILSVLLNPAEKAFYLAKYTQTAWPAQANYIFLQCDYRGHFHPFLLFLMLFNPLPQRLAPALLQ